MWRKSRRTVDGQSRRGTVLTDTAVAIKPPQPDRSGCLGMATSCVADAHAIDSMVQHQVPRRIVLPTGVVHALFLAPPADPVRRLVTETHAVRGPVQHRVPGGFMPPTRVVLLPVLAGMRD